MPDAVPIFNVNAVQIIDADNVEFAKTFDNIGEVLGRDRGAVQALERDALHLVALIGQFEADAYAAEIIAQLTAKGCSGLGVELRVEAIVRLGPCVDDGEIGIVEVSNAGDRKSTRLNSSH